MTKNKLSELKKILEGEGNGLKNMLSNRKITLSLFLVLIASACNNKTSNNETSDIRQYSTVKQKFIKTLMYCKKEDTWDFSVVVNNGKYSKLDIEILGLIDQDSLKVGKLIIISNARFAKPGEFLNTVNDAVNDMGKQKEIIQKLNNYADTAQGELRLVNSYPVYNDGSTGLRGDVVFIPKKVEDKN